jgi:hypothetical protein
MFKKKVVLTAIWCEKLEAVRLAVEVLTGLRVRIKQIDFNTNEGQVVVGETVKNIVVFFIHSDLVEFYFDADKNEYFVARFDDGPYEVRVINRKAQVVEDMKWKVGRSATERWEEPFPR